MSMPWWIIFCLEKFREIWVRGSILFLFHQLIPLLTVSWLGLLSIHCRFRHVEANLLGPMPTRAYLVKGQLEDTTWGCRMTGLVWLGHTWNAVQWPERMIESTCSAPNWPQPQAAVYYWNLELFFFWQHLCSPSRKMQICIYYAFYKLSSSHTKTGG